MIIDVTSPPTGSGLVPNDTAQRAANTANLQAMLDSRFGTYYFPPGRYWISDTINIEDPTTNYGRTGINLMGAGLDPVRKGSGASETECASVICWLGATGKPMVWSKGNGLIWNGLGLCGAGGVGPRASVGLLVEKAAGSAIAASGLWLPAFSIVDCEVGLKAAGAVNADDTALGFYECRDCDVAIEMTEVQNVMWTFESVKVVDVDTVIKNIKGGDLYMESISVTGNQTTILDIEETGNTSGFWHINGLTFDPTVTQGRLVRDVGEATSTNLSRLIRFTNARFSPSASFDALIDRRGTLNDGLWANSVLELVGCLGLDAFEENIVIKGNVFSGTPRRSRLHVINSEVDPGVVVPPPLSLIDQTQSSNYSWMGCDNWTFGGGVLQGTLHGES